MISIIHGDCRDEVRRLPARSIQCVVTSPPYWRLRDYGHRGQIGLEYTPDRYIKQIVEVFNRMRKAIHYSGTIWLNLGDTYSADGFGYGGSRSPKQDTNYGSCYADYHDRRPADSGVPNSNLLGIPWRTALAMQQSKWILRSDIIWYKPDAMPNGTANHSRPILSHEYIFMFAKFKRYYYDYKSSLRDRTVWKITKQPIPYAHFAVFPEELVRSCILASTRPGDVVLDPFAGSGTVGRVAAKLGRSAILIESNKEYVEIIKQRNKKFLIN